MVLTADAPEPFPDVSLCLKSAVSLFHSHFTLQYSNSTADNFILKFTLKIHTYSAIMSILPLQLPSFIRLRFFQDFISFHDLLLLDSACTNRVERNTNFLVILAQLTIHFPLILSPFKLYHWLRWCESRGKDIRADLRVGSFGFTDDEFREKPVGFSKQCFQMLHSSPCVRNVRHLGLIHIMSAASSEGIQMEKVLIAITAGMPNLTSLNLSNNLFLSDDLLIKFFNHATDNNMRLSNLQLSFLPLVTIDSISEILFTLPHLTSVRFKQTHARQTQIPARFWIILLRKFSAVRGLSLHECEISGDSAPLLPKDQLETEKRSIGDALHLALKDLPPVRLDEDEDLAPAFLCEPIKTSILTHIAENCVLSKLLVSCCMDCKRLDGKFLIDLLNISGSNLLSLEIECMEDCNELDLSVISRSCVSLQMLALIYCRVKNFNASLLECVKQLPALLDLKCIMCDGLQWQIVFEVLKLRCSISGLSVERIMYISSRELRDENPRWKEGLYTIEGPSGKEKEVRVEEGDSEGNLFIHMS